MIGEFHVRVKNARNTYNFFVHRNITILSGDSGSGKTTLYDLIYEHNRFGKQSGVAISCERPLVALSGDHWESRLDALSSSIVVIDEDSSFIRSKDFADRLKENDNYFLLITRNYLPQLPYSVDEIYEIKGGKNKRFIPRYQNLHHIYDHVDANILPFRPDVIVTEDGRAGYAFFRHVAERAGVQCMSTNGKSNILKTVKNLENQNILVVADGAAFGSEMQNLVLYQRETTGKLAIFLPESFEWLLLRSGTVGDPSSPRLIKPEEYVDSSKWESWEQYFFDLLVEASNSDKYKFYSKSKLSDYYLQPNVVKKITLGEDMKGISLSS